MKITVDQLRKIATHANKDVLTVVSNHFNLLNDTYQINTPGRICHFLCQIIHESGSFRYTVELADGSAYEGRKDLGNTVSGDGKKFKGRGYIQITGRANYAAVSLHIFDSVTTLCNNPELLAEPLYAMQSAMWFWNSRSLSSYADMPADWRKDIIFRKKKKTVNAFEYITCRINGGFNGLQDRLKYFELAKKVLTL